MFKLLILFILFSSTIYALDFNAIKENIITYVDSLDHPNREIGNNTFSKNLAVAQEAKNTHITIYSVGLAMVWEEKNISIAKPGNVKVMYSNVSDEVDLSSVSVIFDKNVTLYSQKYAYDVVNFTSLLRRYIGKYILYSDNENDKKQKKATLLATDPIIIQDLKNGNIFTPHKIVFENIPEDMAVTPTLFWDINTNEKELRIKLEYLTDGISWKSDYNLYIKDDRQFDLNSWITIANNSGTSYGDANITIITGELQRVNLKENNTTVQKDTPDNDDTIKENNSSSYSLYTIPHSMNLKNKEEKQIAFIRSDEIHYKEYLLNDKRYDLKDLNKTSLHFSKILAFDNTRSNHLGIALPQGVVRLYKYDSLSNKRFLGATKLNNIKKNQTVELSMGDSVDIVGEEKMISLEKTDDMKHIVYAVKLKNSTEKSMVVKLKRGIPDTVGEVIIKDSCQRQCSKKKISKLSTLYNIHLEPNQIYELEIEYLIDTKANIQKGKK